eukprot:1854693-Alexandrium_andersonii.AAC.1
MLVEPMTHHPLQMLALVYMTAYFQHSPMHMLDMPKSTEQHFQRSAMHMLDVQKSSEKRDNC